mmetsp:Transcript_22801/g.77119  ORF Transcript_22801/g.77119 Transcript_22801/m.77119 type:complete len:213 (-) Transcript_22801:1568-2206(-)
MLEDVNRRRMRDRRRRARLVGVQLRNRRRAHVDDQRVYQRDVVRVAVRRRGRPRAQLARQVQQEGDRMPRAKVLVQRRAQVGSVQRHGAVRKHTRRPRDLGQQVHLQVWRKRVRQAHAARERREEEVAQLDAARRDDVAEGEVVVGEEFRKVVQQHQEHAQRALVEQPHRLAQRHLAQVRLQENEEVHQEAVHQDPALLVRREQQIWHKHSV